MARVREVFTSMSKIISQSRAMILLRAVFVLPRLKLDFRAALRPKRTLSLLNCWELARSSAKVGYRRLECMHEHQSWSLEPPNIQA